MSLPITADEFEAQFQKLQQAAAGNKENSGSVSCTDCERCVDSTFCSRSKSLLRCHYCVDCERLSNSTHCRSSADLQSCTHCEACQRCSQSSYLVRAIDCTNCSYCFGCVGLTGKDFHILNRPYPRGEYFALVAKLGKAAAQSARARR